MSELLVDPPRTTHEQPTGGFRNSLDPAEAGFDYKPVPMSAIIGGVLALLSTAALFIWLAIPLAMVSALICLVATITIWRSRGELAGLWLAGGGCVFSLLMAVAGTLLTIQRYHAELPPGYERISFAGDISAKGIGRQEINGQLALLIPKEVRELEGKPIYLKGFIYPSGREYELTSFVLCKDNAQCCFGGEPALQDMIGVSLTKNKTTNYSTSLMGVAGTLRINPDYHGGSVEPIYLLDADYVAPAQTSL